MKALFVVVQLLNGQPVEKPHVNVIEQSQCSFQMRVVDGMNDANTALNTHRQYIATCQEIKQ